MSTFNIDPEAINQYVAQRIIESSIGDSLKTEIDKQVNRLASSYDNPLKPVVANALANSAREYLESPEIKARLREVVEKSFTDVFLEELISKILSEGFRR